MSVVDAPVAGEERARGQLRRELRLFEALAISVGIMAPTAAMALNGVAPAGLVGRAVWPRRPHPYNLFPYFVAGWLVLGIAITLVFPGLAHRIGRNLSRAEGTDVPPGDPKG